MGPEPDPHQVEVLWVPLGELEKLDLVPRALRELLPAATHVQASPYRGRVE